MRQVLAKGLLAAAATTGVFGVAGGTAIADAGANGEAGNSPGVLSGNTVQAPLDIPASACGNSVDVVGVLNPAMGNGCASDAGGDGHHHGGAQHHKADHRQDAGRQQHQSADQQQPKAPAEQRAADAGSDRHGAGGGGHGGGHGGASASGAAQNSPGVGSGNNAEAPVDVPVNLCGNSIDVVGLLNPVMGNNCDSASEEQERTEESVPHHVQPEPAKTAGSGADRAGEGTPMPPAHRETERTAAAGQAAAPADPGVGEQLARTGTEQIGALAGAGAGLVLGGAVLYRRARSAAL